MASQKEIVNYCFKRKADYSAISLYSMLQRYFDIQHFVDKTDPELLQLLPTPIKERKLTEVLQDMNFFESISKKLQSDETTLADIRVLFDGLILKFQDKYPVITNYLATDASVINNQNFSKVSFFCISTKTFGRLLLFKR